MTYKSSAESDFTVHVNCDLGQILLWTDIWNQFNFSIQFLLLSQRGFFSFLPLFFDNYFQVYILKFIQSPILVPIMKLKTLMKPSIFFFFFFLLPLTVLLGSHDLQPFWTCFCFFLFSPSFFFFFFFFSLFFLIKQQGVEFSDPEPFDACCACSFWYSFIII